ncbi:MAG: phage/plasmid primase, P4 family [Pseudomonadota bacterium]
MNAPHRSEDARLIDPAAIEAFADAVFDGLEGYVAIRRLSEPGTPEQKPLSDFCSVHDLAERLKAVAPVAARERRGLYVVPGALAGPGRARATDVAETRVILVDLDAGDIAAKQAHLVEHLGEPTLSVASGGMTDDGTRKLHLYWRLSDVARGTDLDRVRALREAIAVRVGADLSFKSLHQPIRVPGSVHGKYGRTSPVQLLFSSDDEQNLAELVAATEAMPAISGRRTAIDTGALSKSGPSARALFTRKIRANNADEVSRFDALSKVTGHRIRNARLGVCSLEEAWSAVQDHNAAQIDPPWHEERLRREFEALLKRDRAANAWPAGEADAAFDNGAAGGSDNGAGAAPDCERAPAFSEDALATAFAEAHGRDWRHIAAWHTWYCWEGSRWRADDCQYVRELVRRICRTAAQTTDKPRDAQRLASAKTIASVVQIASSDPRIAIGAAALDAHPMLLNTPAGTLDLASGELQRHDRRQLLTQITPASPRGGCPRWRCFLEEVTGGDAALAAYLQRLCGYCLTGDTSEQMLAFFHGHGANGKSVFLQTLGAVLGDYAANATLETFVQTRGSRHLTELAGLRAARVVIVPETEMGAAWAEARIKLVTGGEKIRANFMRRDHFEFAPQFKLLVAGNHRPQLTSVGEAMRRRLHLIPFSVTIPPERRDLDLARKLREERDGILGWMLEGCAAWRRIGLAPPPSMADAAADYFAAEDLVGQWIEECCAVGPQHRATAQALYASWSDYAEKAGEARGTQKALGSALQSRGFMQGKVDARRGWLGLSPRIGDRGREGAA